MKLLEINADIMAVGYHWNQKENGRTSCVRGRQ
jgi:hypothetical protein